MNPPRSLLVLLWLAGGAFCRAGEIPATLKAAAQGHFRLGAAVNPAQCTGADQAGAAVVAAEFDSVTPENALKWEFVHPQPDRYAFALADQFVEFGMKHGMFVIGHTLMWHAQTPDWVFTDGAGKVVAKEELLPRLREHIKTVVGRYRGKVNGWDVVNEALQDDGSLRTDKPWYRILGEEGIYAAFAAAHEADPTAELYYNDYSLENPAKCAGALRLARAIRARGLRIDGVGTQGHDLMDWPSIPSVDAMVAAFAAADVKLMVTEFDITVLPRPMNYWGADIAKNFGLSAELDPYRQGLPAEKQQALARRYGELFAAYARHPGVVTRVTLWGVGDRTSWLNDWPIRGRKDYPLLFDRDYRPKPAHAAVIAALQAAAVR